MAMKTKQDLMQTVGDYLKAKRKASQNGRLTYDELNEAIVDILPILMTDSQPTNADVVGAYSLFVERFAECSDKIGSAVNIGVSRVRDESINAEQRLRLTISQAEHSCEVVKDSCKEIEELLEKVQKIKREPNATRASSLNPERWFCDLCGCKMGRVALDGDTWDYLPRFCPGCGAPVGQE